MTGPEVITELSKIHEQRVALAKESDKLSLRERQLISQCPHDKRMAYRACGVETDRCVYCGHEIGERSY